MGATANVPSRMPRTWSRPDRFFVNSRGKGAGLGDCVMKGSPIGGFRCSHFRPTGLAEFGHRHSVRGHWSAVPGARYAAGMFARALLTFTLVGLAGACAAPPPTTTAPPPQNQQTLRFPNGDLYVGQMIEGRREGQGIYTWSDGRRYVGTFRAGLEEGQGTYSYPNGDQYAGQFQANRRTGQGIYSWPDGRKYVGEFRDDKPNGSGTYSWADGKQYVGEFKGRVADGQGTYTC